MKILLIATLVALPTAAADAGTVQKPAEKPAPAAATGPAAVLPSLLLGLLPYGAASAVSAAQAPAAGAGTPPSLQAAALSIALSHSGKDEVGSAFLDRVKEALGQSGSLHVVEPEASPQLALRLSTLNPLPGKPGVQAVAAWALVVPARNDSYLSGGVSSLVADNLKAAAEALVKTVEGVAARHVAEIPGTGDALDAERAWRAAAERAAGRIRLEARRELFLQHMDLQRQVLQLKGFALPADVSEMAGSLAAEYDEADARLLTDELASCRTELATLKKSLKKEP